MAPSCSLVSPPNTVQSLALSTNKQIELRIFSMFSFLFAFGIVGIFRSNLNPSFHLYLQDKSMSASCTTLPRSSSRKASEKTQTTTAIGSSKMRNKSEKWIYGKGIYYQILRIYHTYILAIYTYIPIKILQLACSVLKLANGRQTDSKWINNWKPHVLV